jgi:hypothetical protein
MKLSSKFRRAAPWVAAGSILLAAAAFFTWQRFAPAQSAEGWSFKVYRENIPQVAALALDAQGNLYVSQEFTNGRGVIFRLSPDGARHDILSRLSKPDGMTPYKDGIIASQENPQKPVLRWSGGRAEPLLSGNNVEGLANDGRRLFAVEDIKKAGRLLEYDFEKKRTRILRENLDEPEGVALCPDGGLFFTEKAKGWIKRLDPGSQDAIIVRGLRHPAFLMCNEEGLWVTEDSTHRARLLRLDASGKIRVILTNLRSPQAIVSAGGGRFLLAEQGRGRILELYRTADAAR